MKNYFIILIFSYLCCAQHEFMDATLKKIYAYEKDEKYIEATKELQKLLNNTQVLPAEKVFVKDYLAYFNYLQNKQSITTIKNLQVKLLQIQKRSTYQVDLLLKTYKIYYNYLLEVGSRQLALEKALEGKALKDFELASTNIKIDYLFDLGTLYRKVENPYEAIFYFNKSIEISTATKENNTSLANSYNALGDAYLENYNPTKANEYYKKAIAVLEKITLDKPKAIDELLEGYRNLIRSLIEYGAKIEVEKFKNKANILFEQQRQKLKTYSKDLYFHSRQMQVHCNVLYFAAHGNFKNATNFCDSLKSETKFNKENIDAVKFAVNRYFDVVDYLYDFEQYDLTIKKAHELEPIINQFNLVWQKMLVNAKLGTSYEKIKDYKKALYNIEIAEQVVDQEHFNSSKFSIQIIKAIILSGMNKHQEAIDISKNVVEQLVYENTENKIAVENIKFENVSELADTYFINIFEKVAVLYLKQHKKFKKESDIKIAENLYQIAGKLFQEYYLKGEFNDDLSYYHQRITEGLLECSLLQKEDFKQKLTNLNIIERNASQHLLKEFDKKIKRKVSANTTYQSEINDLKKELLFYKNQKTTQKSEIVFNQQQIKSLQEKIDSLKEKISKTEKNYSKFNATNFDLNEVVSNLKEQEQLLKYYVCSNTIYALLLTKNNIEIKKIGDKKTIENKIKNYLSQTNNAQSNFKKDSNNLYAVLMPFKLKNKITIIPDSFLNYLPFETLFDAKTQKYVVENHIVSYDYSLPLLLLHLQNKEKNFNQSLAIFSPFYNQKTGDKRSDFKDLKFAKQESQQIAALFGGTLFAKEKATKANFINQKENFDIFHLSMHSQLFEDDFNKSCLLFSNDERLFFSDLYGMNIPASMVVLSACNTGNGILKSGEGIMSINRALTYAGVKSAVVSLWQVPDKETSEIMVSFYKNLKKGQAKDEALAYAKTTFIKNNPMKNHPFYWAGFVVNGDVSPIVSGTNWLLFLAIGFSVVVLLFVFRKKLVQFRK